MRIFLLMLTSLPLLSQEPQLQIDLTGQWKITNSDRPEFARPDFDDRAWNTAAIPFRQPRPFGNWWLRRNLEIPPEWTGSSDLVLCVGALNEVYEVFVNGERMAKVGEPSLSASYIARPRSFPIPRNVVTRRVTVALRLWTPQGLSWSSPRTIGSVFPDEGPWRIATSAIAPRHAAAASMARRERSAVPSLIFGVMFGLLGLILIAGWLMQSSRMDLLALAGFLFSEGYRLITLYWGVAADSSHISDMAAGLTLSMSPLLLNYFLVSRKVRWSRWPLIPMWLALVCHIGLNTGISLANGRWLPGYGILFVLTDISHGGLLIVAAMAVVHACKMRKWRQALIEGGIVLILLSGYSLLGIRLNLNLQISGMSWSIRNFIVFGLAFGLTLVLIRELGAARQRLAQELEAARIVQQLLLPPSAATGVEAAYLPALEVGGDFWQAAALPSGGLLLVIGDVSGKGLGAAMVVSMVVGVIRSNTALGPARLLAELNRVLLLGRPGGFVTCCAAQFLPGGEVVLANAGHCYPLCEARELELLPGLPLGVIPEVEWQETRISTGGASLTFVSDGVIEAVNANGELFGFQRTAAISIKTAGEIAEAAKAWGQNDDITVVTVRRAGAVSVGATERSSEDSRYRADSDRP